MTFYYFEKKFGWQVPLIDRRWTMVVGKSAREKIQPINQTEQSQIICSFSLPLSVLHQESMLRVQCQSSVKYFVTIHNVIAHDLEKVKAEVHGLACVSKSKQLTAITNLTETLQKFKHTFQITNTWISFLTIRYWS